MIPGVCRLKYAGTVNRTSRIKVQYRSDLTKLLDFPGELRSSTGSTSCYLMIPLSLGGRKGLIVSSRQNCVPTLTESGNIGKHSVNSLGEVD